ncbi:MAG: tetratricopeptide repeat protein [Ectothiorhodospiraceae bacterium]|nr:tetratricopeptide repeat protein [Ectothiorhodospiraceae bacterium]
MRPRHHRAGGVAAVVAAALLAVTTPGHARADEMARSLLDAGQYVGAIAAARGALVEDSASAATWRVLAEARAATGAIPAALDAYARALELGIAPRLPVEVAMAKLRLRIGEEGPALERLRAAVDVYRADSGVLDAETLVAAGDAARVLGRRDVAMYTLAVRIYEAALSREPRHADARLALGELLLEKSNNAEALDLFREVLEAEPTNARAMLALARSHHFDHSDVAVEVVQRALELQPTLVPAWVLRARLLIETEDYDGAETAVAQALAVDPTSPPALTLAAAVRYLRGERRGFDRLLAEIRHVAPGFPAVYETLAEIAAQNRRYQDAVEFAIAAVAIDRESWRAHALLGLNRLRTGDIAAARRSLDTAFRGDPYDVQVKNTLDLLDRLAAFETRTAGRFTLVADPREVDVLAPLLFPVAEDAWARMSERYGHEPRGSVRIEVYPRHEDFSVRTVGLVGIDILGVSFGPVVALDSPSAEHAGPLNWASVLWHELAHTFHLSMSWYRVPRWFSEGLAVVEERRARPGWGQDASPRFLEAFAAHRLPAASRLNDAFLRPESPEQVGHAYYQASLLIEMIEDRAGVEGLRAMLTGYRNGRTTNELLTEVLGLDTAALDAAFDGYLRDRYGHALAALTAPEEGEPAPFPKAWREGGEALEAGDLDRAEAALVRARELFPEYVGPDSPHHLLATLHERRGDTAAAIAALEAVVAINADDLDAHRRLAALHFAAGDTQAGREVVERSLLIDPFAIDSHERLAALAESAARWEDAVARRAAVVALGAPDRAEAHYRLAAALAGAGQNEDARREVLSALEVAPLYDEALELLLRVREPTPASAR